MARQEATCVFYSTTRLRKSECSARRTKALREAAC